MTENRIPYPRIPERLAGDVIREKLTEIRTQTEISIAERLIVRRKTVRRHRKSSDLYISTLRGYVEGVGGKLSLVVEFPDHPPVILAGLGMDEEPPSEKRGRKMKKTGGVKAESKAKSAGKTPQSA